MGISQFNNVSYNNSFKAKPNIVSKVANKALLPTAVCAYIMSPLLGLAKQPYDKDDVQYQKEIVIDDKKYTMTYVNSDENFGEKAVPEFISPLKAKNLL